MPKQGLPLFRNPFTRAAWAGQFSRAAAWDAVKNGGVNSNMGTALIAEGLPLLERGMGQLGRVVGRIFGSRTGRAAAKIAATKGFRTAATLIGGTAASEAVAYGTRKALARYGTGASGPNIVSPIDFGAMGYTGGSGGGGGGGGGGTSVTRSGDVFLPNGAIFRNGKMYIGRQTRSGGVRLQHVKYDRHGQLVPAPKHMNVLNPRALSRATRRVDGFHKVAKRALHQMEKWATKNTHRRAAPARGKFGKKK